MQEATIDEAAYEDAVEDAALASERLVPSNLYISLRGLIFCLG